MRKYPFISVIITAYNRKDFLVNSIKSALNQTLGLHEFEVIVIKNFTDDFIDEFIGGTGVKSILIDDCSIGEMLSEGIRQARGDVISFLDDDDEFEPTKLYHVFDNFQNPGILFYRNSYSLMNFNGEKIGRIYREDHRLVYSGRAAIFNAPIKIRMNMSCISVRRNLLKDNIEIIEKFKSAQDLSLFYIAASANGKLVLDKDKLTRYRYNPQSVTHLHNTKNFLLQVETLKFLESQNLQDFVLHDIKKTRLRISLITFVKGESFDRGIILSMFHEYLGLKGKNFRDFSSLVILLLILFNIHLGSFVLRTVTSHGGNYE